MSSVSKITPTFLIQDHNYGVSLYGSIRQFIQHAVVNQFYGYGINQFMFTQTVQYQP